MKYLPGIQKVKGAAKSNLVSILIFLGAAITYLFSLVRVHTYDALSYAYSAQMGPQELERFLYPHHLGYHLAAYGYYQIWKLFGWDSGSILPLQLINVFCGSLCLVFFYNALKTWINRTTALNLTLLLLVANGFWLFSVEVEVYIPSMLLLLVTFILISRLDPSRWTAVIGVGMAWGAAILAHQTNLLFLPAIAVGVFQHPIKFVKKIQVLVYISLSALCIVLIPYAAAISALQLDSLKQIYLWLTWLAQVGKWGFLQDNSILLAIAGARGALINITQQQTNASALYLQLTAFLILLSGCSYRGYKVSPKITLLCLTWFAVFALFFIWWEPQNIEFWVGLLAPVLILIGLAIESIPFSVNWRKLAHGSILIMVILLGWNNWMATIQPNRHPESNGWLQKMRAVGKCIGTDNTVFLNTGSLWAWLVYYDHIDVQVLDRIFLKSQRDAEDRVVSQSFDQVHSFIQEAYLHKRKVFWLSDTNDSTPLMRKYGVDQSTLEQLFGDYQKIPVACPYPLYEIRSP